MADSESWSSICTHGLLSTKAIADEHLKLSGHERFKLLSEHRKDRMIYPGFKIRDQRPMNTSMLTKVLQDGTSPREWFELLNGKVFLWARKKKITKDDRLLLFLNIYRKDAQIVLEIDSARFLHRHAHHVSLCHINSGATRSVDHKRSPKSFVSFEEYSLVEHGEVAEVTVETSLPDVQSMLTRASRVGQDGVEEVLFEQPC